MTIRAAVVKYGIVENLIIIEEANIESFRIALGADYILNEEDYDPKPQIEWTYSNGVFSPPEPPPEEGE